MEPHFKKLNKVKLIVIIHLLPQNTQNIISTCTQYKNLLMDTDGQ